MRWDVWRDNSNDHCCGIDELYRDATAVEAHRGSRHCLACLARFPNGPNVPQ
ncbi:hypothetical protein [Bradyrhizobium sp. 159]|uniref:hypothetical protein n=1 Tax=Bradyrhizobium sp. 159 TaxID=2782632 RepID=UPI001FF702FA|nr:hypothetical protein [Bradyrhizobium sp. 159]